MKKNSTAVTAFYDRIAEEYDHQLTASDKQVRRVVSGVFRQYIPRGNVLDFGGGTGLDLPWLLAGDYHVFFLEPSVNMRAIAKKAANVIAGINRPVFLEEHTDIRDWSSGSLPVLEKMNGVLADFAVLNCIAEPAIFFEKIALVCERHCYIVACVIDARPRVLLKNHPVKAVMRGFLNGEIITRHTFNGACHETHIHFQKRFRAAYRRHFDFIAHLPVAASDFALLILSKK
ncbi:MAG TPA: hypothetical protein VIU45_05030 [Chitinophagaceae bacterium]